MFGLVALASYALFNIVTQKHDTRFIFVALGFITVGVGSWMFHMSLLYEFQLLDELPMIYATCIPYWIVFSHGQTQTQSRKIAAQITFAALALTAIYLHYRDPTIHQAAYGILNAIIILKGVNLSYTYCNDPAARRNLNLLSALGIASFLSGYALWNLDIHLCDMWRSTRREIGIPWGFFLEGHGWWHLLTGYGVYLYVVYLEYLGLYMKQNGEENIYDLIWSYGFLPHLDIKKGVVFDKEKYSAAQKSMTNADKERLLREKKEEIANGVSNGVSTGVERVSEKRAFK